MTGRTARSLARLTGEFYALTSSSFADTRRAPWPGWQRVLDLSALWSEPSPSVLDLACGNLRFEQYLAAERANHAYAGELTVHAFDACDQLVATAEDTGLDVRFVHLDVVQALFDGQDLSDVLGVSDCSLAACFGFMHHLALPQHRLQVMRALVRSVKPGGVVAVSLWQLSHSKKLLDKALTTTSQAAQQLGLDDLGPGDYLLGWKERTDVLRFCHDFSEEDVDGLAACAAGEATEVARFSADGATGNLNRYLVLRRR